MTAFKLFKCSTSPCASGADSAAISTAPSQETTSLSGRYSSSTKWKLLPPKPKALTPDLRG